MNYEVKQGHFYKSLMSGVFTGIIATIVNLLYNYVYRGLTTFSLSHMINVTTIIFVTMILATFAGILYYLIVPHLNKSKVFFFALFAVVMLVAIFLGLHFNRTGDAGTSAQFRGLFIGIVIITGALSTFLIPYLEEHNNPLF